VRSTIAGAVSKLDGRARFQIMPYKDPVKQRAYRARWHAENYHGERRARHLADKLQRQRAIAAFVAEYKSAHPCVRCGEDDPACLDFHHTLGTKEAAVAHAASHGWSQTKTLAEIAKCIVLCANCHRKLHRYERD
jgi:hypothetical protein